VNNSKRHTIGALGLFLLLVLGAAGVVAVRFMKTPPVAHFERDQEAFVGQVRASDGTYVENAGTPIFDNRVVQASPPRPAAESVSQVLGVDTAAVAEKRIEVDLSEQKLTTWAGTKKLKEYPVSTGMAGSPTVQGEFHVWRKVLSQGYRGGSKLKGTYYYLPNVPYSLFFHNGYAIHGAYWHNDFGIRPRSHGCVNMRNDDAREVYDWANPVMPAGLTAFNADETNPGTRIAIHE
jgi:lipoprotein-anchoring transpeptidase ErfK/SrfK